MKTSLLTIFKSTAALVAVAATLFAAPKANAEGAWASIDNLTVTPRMAGQSTTDSLDVVATGINTVGVNKVVYLQPIPTAAKAASISG